MLKVQSQQHLAMPAAFMTILQQRLLHMPMNTQGQTPQIVPNRSWIDQARC
jgi:hypothetical protein